MDENEGRLPLTDTPQFDILMHHVQLIKDLTQATETFPVGYRKALAVAEFTFYRKMVACGLDNLFDYSVMGRATWNLDIRWAVPRKVTSEGSFVKQSRLPSCKELRGNGKAREEWVPEEKSGEGTKRQRRQREVRRDQRDQLRCRLSDSEGKEVRK